MKQEAQLQVEEPVGIVISSGREPVMAPRFTAFMWAPGPEDESDLAPLAA